MNVNQFRINLSTEIIIFLNQCLHQLCTRLYINCGHAASPDVNNAYFITIQVRLKKIPKPQNAITVYYSLNKQPIIITSSFVLSHANAGIKFCTILDSQFIRILQRLKNGLKSIECLQNIYNLVFVFVLASKNNTSYKQKLI